jgi:hypothetical protein
MSQVIRIPDDLYRRLERHANGFDTPASVIKRILDHFEGASKSSTTVAEDQRKQPIEPATNLEVVYYPEGELNFKQALLEAKQAYVRLHKTDGSSEVKVWNASKFSKYSDVNNNLRSGYLRGWRSRGICKAEVAIEMTDID